MIIIFVIIMAFGIGMFGVVHTGILNNIAARTYAWETFNHRTNLNLFRDNRGPDSLIEHYVAYGFRLHSIQSEYAVRDGSDLWTVTERTIAMGRETETASTRNQQTHRRLNQLTKRERIGVNPVWIKTLYGICLNSKCGTVNL